ncbi:hypothetical protein NL676_037513 [Syzygium grande]|nr:hypothetical protein NL676_037513 [Syzygium grande]
MALMLEEATIMQAIVAVVLALNLLTHHLLHSPTIPGARNRLHASKVVPVLGAFGPKSLTFNSSGEGPCTDVIDDRVLNWGGNELVLLFIVDKSAGVSLMIERGDIAASSDRDNARPTVSLAASLENETTASLQLQTNRGMGKTSRYRRQRTPSEARGGSR